MSNLLEKQVVNSLDTGQTFPPASDFMAGVDYR